MSVSDPPPSSLNSVDARSEHGIVPNTEQLVGQDSSGRIVIMWDQLTISKDPRGYFAWNKQTTSRNELTNCVINATSEGFGLYKTPEQFIAWNNEQDVNDLTKHHVVWNKAKEYEQYDSAQYGSHESEDPEVWSRPILNTALVNVPDYSTHNITKSAIAEDFSAYNTDEMENIFSVGTAGDDLEPVVIWDKHASFCFNHLTHKTSNVFATAFSAGGGVFGAVVAAAVGIGSLGIVPYIVSKIVTPESYGVNSGKFEFVALGRELGRYFGENLGKLVGYVIGVILSPIAIPLNMALDPENNTQSKFDKAYSDLEEERIKVRKLLNTHLDQALITLESIRSKEHESTRKLIEYHISQLDSHSEFEATRKCIDSAKAFIRNKLSDKITNSDQVEDIFEKSAT